jgi:hypothetical protein
MHPSTEQRELGGRGGYDGGRDLERRERRVEFVGIELGASGAPDLLRELRKLKPAVVHFCGHVGPAAAGGNRPGPAPHRDVIGGHDHGGEPQHGLYFQGPDGFPQLVSAAALEETFGAVEASGQAPHRPATTPSSVPRRRADAGEVRSLRASVAACRFVSPLWSLRATAGFVTRSALRWRD